MSAEKIDGTKISSMDSHKDGNQARSFTPREFCSFDAGSRNGRRSVFLAGVTSQKYEKWRTETAARHFHERGIDTIDPLDPNWVTESLQFERESLERADLIFCVLAEDALGVISLMELCAHRQKEIVVVSKKMEGLYYKNGSGELKECSSGVNYARQALEAYLTKLKFIEVDASADLMEAVVDAIHTEYVTS